jgi:cold shock CspA family protein
MIFDLNNKTDIIGKVKWYNIDLRYGFIVINIDNKEHDIFIHRNNIKSNIKYKCLFKGEYVLFDIKDINNKTQCINVRGINNDKLLCESNPDLLKKFILGQYIEKINPNLSYFKISS